MAHPRVSVVLPVHNGGALLGGAIESVLRQTETELELVAVDDGSTDTTPDVLAASARMDARVRVVTHRRRRGIVAALNAGLDAARAALIARMDADDSCHPARLQRQCDALDSRPDLGLVACCVRHGAHHAAQAGYAGYVEWTNTLLTPEQIALNRFIESPFAHPSVVFRRPLLESLGGYRDGPFPEDYELWLRWLDAGVKMAKLGETLLTWRDLPGRLSRTDSRYAVRAFYRCKAQYLARWLAANNPHHPDVIVWGAGRETRKRAEHLVDYGIRVRAYIDVDPRKIGQTICGRAVLDPESVPPADTCFVLPYVGSRGARSDIRARLAARGFVEGRQFISAA